MDEATAAPAGKKPRLGIDYRRCIICQAETDQELVMVPTSHEKVLNLIKERAGYGDGDFPEISRRLGNVTHEILELNSATWHRKCYQDTVHVGMCKRAKERYEKKLSQKGTIETSSSQSFSGSVTFTRSQSAPYNRELCFFCEQKGTNVNPLHKVATKSAGQAVKKAVENSGNDRLSVKLCTSIDPEDGHAIDIRYHKRCWATHVTNIEHRSKNPHKTMQSMASELGAEIEFLSLVEGTLLDGKAVSMAVLQEVYENILCANNVLNTNCSRKKIKQLLVTEIPEVEFHKPKRVNEAELVTLKRTRDAAVQMMEDSSDNCEEDMRTLYSAAASLRKAICKADKWTFTGSLSDVTSKQLPKELYCFYRWVLQGPQQTLSTDKKSSEVNKNASSLAQSTVTMFLSNDQVSNKKSQSFRMTHEMPNQLAVGVAIRQAIRSKKIINILHGFGISADYTRLLRMEGQIANAITQKMILNDGVYIPPDVVHGRHIFFAVDNVDFAEDTPDGKRTLHGTAMAIYQRCQPEDEAPRLELMIPTPTTTRKDQTLSDIKLLDCPKPTGKPSCPVYTSFSLQKDLLLSSDATMCDAAWLFGRTLARCHQRLVEEPCEQSCEIGLDQDEDVNCAVGNIPTWAAYNSLLENKLMPTTRVGTPPLIAAPAHEWTTLLTVLMQAQGISAKVVGPERKTVISLDMGLYKPAKQLQMARKDMNNIILRPGELHILMAQLRCIGAYIENSGLDFCWTEADLYGPATVKQILEGKHVKRGLEAHVVTLQSLFQLYQSAFLKDHPDMQKKLTTAAEALDQACADGSCKEVQAAHSAIAQVIQSCRVLDEMSQFDSANAKKPLVVVMRQYMQMVMEMLAFVRSVRTGDWKLHLLSLETFTKHFFSLDKLVYARMIPLYLADMNALSESDVGIYEELLQGNWVVNKNKFVPFCAIGADHALEHINRSMKVAGGLTGITLNAYARSKFFLISPELARLAGEAREMASVPYYTPTHHHALSPAQLTRQAKNIHALIATLQTFTNPFEEDSCELLNLVTKAVMPDKVNSDLCNVSNIGKQLLEEFITNRIKSSTINLWAPMKTQRLQTWKITGKKVKVNTGSTVIELKEDRKLFSRMLILSKSRPTINLQETVGNYELSVVPRSMFAADGTMLHCPMKSVLMSALENLSTPALGVSDSKEASTFQETGDTGVEEDSSSAAMTVAIVDAMAEVQSLDKPDYITNCSQLADQFTSRILQRYSDADEVHLVFDRYDVPTSLKTKTRARRQGTKPVISYHITDTTNIAKIPMTRLLSNVKTKMELTNYLAEKMLVKAHAEKKRMVVAWSTQCQATHMNVRHLCSQQEEADTKLLLHAADVTSRGASTINIHSPDTDVFILALRRYPELCTDTNFLTGTGTKRRTIHLQHIYDALGSKKAAALPGLHAFSGADNTGSFAGKGKIAFWKRFLSANDGSNEISALARLGTTKMPSEETCAGLEEFLCKVYLPGTNICLVDKLRWWMFTKKQTQSERLPPTRDALHQAILRAHYQVIIWNNDTISNPEVPSPQDYGWNLDGDEWVPVMTTQLPAPNSVIQLVKCGCAKTKCDTDKCTCRKAKLDCTDLCGCCDIGEVCDNAEQMKTDTTDSDEEDDEIVDDEYNEMLI